MKELVCIVCPKGCRLQVDVENDYAVTGNACPRGAVYGHNEIKNPTRVLTSTVKVQGGLYRRCPVKSDIAVPKGKLMEIVTLLNQVELTAPVSIGQVVLPHPAGTDANIIATKEM
ncbi:MAG: DUF1667 domain-containing protein [Clostridia bacterium]|nr:DUF1667 domain-containing protein [Clostridia bacterium]